MTTLTAPNVLETRLQRVYARGRVADALLGIALDVLQPYASDYLPGSDFRHLCDLLKSPVDAATDVALAAFLDALTVFVQDADPQLMARFEAVMAPGNRAAG